MDEQKYLRLGIFGIIVFVICIVGYGVFINSASQRHVEKMEAAQYTALPVAYADYRDVRAQIQGLDVTARTEWTIDVHAQYEGVLSDLRVKKAQRVTGGEILAVMTNTDLAARIASADADIESARATLIDNAQIAERYKKLVESNAIAVQEYDSAAAKRDASAAELAGRIAQRDLVRSDEEKMIITAEQDASVIHIYHGQGDYVRTGEALFMLSDLSRLRAYVNIEHNALKELLNAGSDFIIEIPSYRLTNKAYPGSGVADDALPPNQFRAKLESVTPGMESGADYHETVWRVENSTGIMEPTYYNGAKIIAQKSSRVLAIPAKALHIKKNGGEAFVYGLDSESRLVKKSVTVGIIGETAAEITGGIKKGDAVVIADPAAYTEGMIVRALNEASPQGAGEFSANTYS